MKEVWRNVRKQKKIMKDNKKFKGKVHTVQKRERGRERKRVGVGWGRKKRTKTCVLQEGKLPNIEITLTQVYDILKLMVLFKCDFFVFLSIFSREYFALLYFEQLARSPPHSSLFGPNDSCYSVGRHCYTARLLMSRPIFLCDDATSLLFLRVRT